MMKHAFLILAPLFCCLAPTSRAAISAQSPALGAATNANAFIFNNAHTQGGHSDGSMVVGGNWSGSYYEIRQHGNTPVPEGPFGPNTALYLGGDNNVSNYLRTLNGDAYIAGDPKPVQINGGGKFYSQSFDLAPTMAKLERLSGDLFKLSSQTLTINDPNNVKVNLAANTLNGDLKVYNIDGSKLTGGKTLDFTGATGNETIVINVTGDTVDWGWSTNYSGNNLLWNFEAKKLNIRDREFTGTILATDATVTQRQNINGTLISENWRTEGSPELHSRTFKGKIPLVSAPEPGGVLVMGGFLGLLLCSRDKRSHRKGLC